MLDGFMLILPIMCCVMTGWFLKRIGALTDEGGDQMGILIFYVASPCLVFRFTFALTPADFADFGYMAVLYAGYAAMALSSCAVGLLRGQSRARRAASVLVSLRSNNVFMGYPAVVMLWGESRLGFYGRYMAISVLGVELVSAAASLLVLNGGLRLSALRRFALSLFKNPIVVGILAALVWGMGLKLPMPRFLDISMKIFGDIGTGLALMSLGMRLRPSRLWGDFLATWPDAALRLLLSPLLLAAGYAVVPARPEMVKIAVLVMAMPAAMNTFSMADAMGMDGDYAARATMVSTVASALTLPLVIRFLF